MEKQCIRIIFVEFACGFHSGSSMSLFGDLPAENASTASEDGGVESGRKRSSCDSLNDHTPPAKLTKTWCMFM